MANHAVALLDVPERIPAFDPAKTGETSGSNEDVKESIRTLSIMFALILFMIAGPMATAQDAMSASRFQSKAQQESLDKASASLKDLDTSIKMKKSLDPTMSMLTTGGLVGGGALAVIVGVLFVVAVVNCWNPIGWLLGAGYAATAAVLIGVMLISASICVFGGVAMASLGVASYVDARNAQEGKENWTSWAFIARGMLANTPDAKSQLLAQTQQTLAQMLSQGANQKMSSTNKTQIEGMMQLIQQYCSQMNQALQNWAALANTQSR